VILLICSWIVVSSSARPGPILLLFSGIFYLVAGPVDSLTFALALVVNWMIRTHVSTGRARLIVSVVANIGLLAYFKYSGFLTFDSVANVSYVDRALPLGISFYCFQFLAYQIDVTRRATPEAERFPVFALFIAFFPQLIAGPIVRASQLVPQVARLFSGIRRKHRLLVFGLALCAVGMIKKVVFADSLAPHVDNLFSTVPGTAFDAWTGAALFTFQIYFDFSGYSDIAIGSAYILGIRLPTNFATPYVSSGPREFWKRWHISLSSWIRDYLYIPLGGNRGRSLRAAAVLLATMSIAGLWHGANYTFAVWGFGWGLYIVLVRIASRILVLPRIAAWPLHIATVMILWVFFRSPDLIHATSHISAMFGLGTGIPEGLRVGAAPEWFVASSIGGMFLLHWVECRLHSSRVLWGLRRYNHPFFWGLLGGIAVLLTMFPSFNVNPFIYFRF
jgi:alginate O-acetyltransferase complex protein AlgI